MPHLSNNPRILVSCIWLGDGYGVRPTILSYGMTMLPHMEDYGEQSRLVGVYSHPCIAYRTRDYIELFQNSPISKDISPKPMRYNNTNPYQTDGINLESQFDRRAYAILVGLATSLT